MTDFEQARAAGRERSRFRDLSEIAKLINSGLDVATVLRRLARGVCHHGSWSMSGIQALDIEQRASIPIVRYDPYSDRNAPFPTGWDAETSPIERVLAERAPLVIHDAPNQDLFPGYRDDARRRSYQTVVILPLDGQDEQDRPIVLSVIARERLGPDAAEIDFLRCIADLTAIALQKLRRLEAEAAATRQLQDMTESLTDVMGQALSRKRETTFPAALTRLMPSPWLAIDLTTGRLLHDPDAAPAIVTETGEDILAALIAEARGAQEAIFARSRTVRVADRVFAACIEPIVIDGVHAGAVFLFGLDQLDEKQQLAAEAGRLALSSHLLRDFVMFQTRALSAEQLMRRLFDGDWRDAEELRSVARTLDFQLQPPLRLLLVSAGEGEKAQEHLHRSCQRLAQRAFGASLSCRIEGVVALLLEHGEAFEGEAARTAFFEALTALLPKPPLLVLSPIVEQLGGVADARQHAMRRLKVAHALGREGWVTSKRLGAFTALMAAVDSATMESFLADTVGPIAADDRRRGKANLETIEAFLQSGGRYQATADRLGIHVSTLRYRLEQIGERFDLDFADTEALFDLDVALRLYRLRDSYES